jgi:hypothetical protein
VNSATQALRLRSTRQLWDPAYSDESWIGQPVSLVPRMHDWVDNNYPGTKLAITEYNWGALGYMNGALAQADILGIFGRQGLDFATIWGPPESDEPGAYAFRIYRNYDGLGGQFGETGVRAESEDESKLSVYAAQRTADSALTVVVINKTAGELTSTLTIDGFSHASTAQVFRYTEDSLNEIVQGPEIPVASGIIEGVFPGFSITVIVIGNE